jgi:hypothetical protein
MLEVSELTPETPSDMIEGRFWTVIIKPPAILRQEKIEDFKCQKQKIENEADLAMKERVHELVRSIMVKWPLIKKNTDPAKMIA